MCTIHNYLRIEQLNDPLLKHQDSRLLATVETDGSNERMVGKDIHGVINGIQVKDVWTTYRGAIAL